MALLNDILEWTQSLPAWQRDACRRLLLKEDGLRADDYSELYSLLKKEGGIDVDDPLVPVPLASEHLPAELPSGETVTLVALRELKNVNLIPSDHALTFSEAGMTVIYGGNGSGKSGYARVMKRACRARDQSEPIHPNANDPAATTRVPTAKFDVKVAGSSEEIEWSRDAAPPDRLSTISVFDSKCARSCITAEQDVAYLPYGLDIVENLANLVLPKVLQELEAEIEGIDVNTLPFVHLLGETEVGKVIGELSAKSDPDQISSLGALTDDDKKRISDLQAALKEDDPLTKAEEYRLSAIRLKTYAETLTKPLVWVSTEAVEDLKELADGRKVAEAAETRAADALRAGEDLLAGTGDQVWKLLFESARRYSTEVAFPGEAFPPTDQGKACPLCQEDLGEAGTQRLSRFDEYIKNDVATAADSARKREEAAKARIEAADLEIAADEALNHELSALDDSVPARIAEFQTSIDARRSSILKCLDTSNWAEIPTLANTPRPRVRQLAVHQLRTYRTLVKAADEEKRKELEEALSELSARQSLATSLTAILELLDRIKRQDALEKCRSSLKTPPVATPNSPTCGRVKLPRQSGGGQM